MKNAYNTPELLSVGAINEVVLGEKTQSTPDAGLVSFGSISVLDID